MGGIPPRVHGRHTTPGTWEAYTPRVHGRAIHPSGYMGGLYTPGYHGRLHYRVPWEATLPGTMVGIGHPVHHGGYRTPCTPWWYIPTIHPGYTTIPPCWLLVPRSACWLSWCAEREPWAQSGRNAWVRALLRVNVSKGVMGERPLCAELLRSFR